MKRLATVELERSVIARDVYFRKVVRRQGGRGCDAVDIQPEREDYEDTAVGAQGFGPSGNRERRIVLIETPD